MPHYYSAHMRHRVLHPISHITLSTRSFQSVTNWFLNMLLGCYLLNGRWHKQNTGLANSVNNHHKTGHTAFVCNSSTLPTWPGYHTTNSCRISHSSQAQCSMAKTIIWQEFELGLQHLLLADHFHVQLSNPSEGFSLESVLALPLLDQQLWIHSIWITHSCGSHILANKLARMQSSFHCWLHPNNEILPTT